MIIISYEYNYNIKIRIMEKFEKVDMSRTDKNHDTILMNRIQYELDIEHIRFPISVTWKTWAENFINAEQDRVEYMNLIMNNESFEFVWFNGLDLYIRVNQEKFPKKNNFSNIFFINEYEISFMRGLSYDLEQAGIVVDDNDGTYLICITCANHPTYKF